MSGSSHYSVEIADVDRVGIKEVKGYFILNRSYNASAESQTTLKLMIVNHISLVCIHTNENRDAIDKRLAFPADFINEGVDQTRGWFFTLHAIATMVFDSVAFKNVISTGLVLDSKGNKMSKHVGNVVNPFEMIEKYGADAVRFYMMTNSEPWDNLKFDPEGVDEVRQALNNRFNNLYPRG